MNASDLTKNQPQKYNLLIENVQDFHIKKDFMLATRKVLNNTQLFISYKRGRFVRADFQTELEIKVKLRLFRLTIIFLILFIDDKFHCMYYTGTSHC